MTPHIPENVSTWLVNWTLVSIRHRREILTTMMRRRTKKTKRMRTRTKNRRASENPTNNAAHTRTPSLDRPNPELGAVPCHQGVAG
jgi:hypothetical protein